MPENIHSVESYDLSPEAKAMLLKLAKGGSLRYFFLHGDVAVHDANGKPAGETCPAGIFRDLREKGLIEISARDVIGYPDYADNHKSDEYKISDEGRLCIE